eukprot:RCo022461
MSFRGSRFLGSTCSTASLLRSLLVFLLLLRFSYIEASVAASPAAVSGLPGGGTGLLFPSDPSLALLQGFAALSGTSVFTVECWVYSRSYSELATFFTLATRLNLEYFQINVYQNAMQFGYGDYWALVPVDYPPGWHHIAVTVSSTHLEGFFDGVPYTASMEATLGWPPAFTEEPVSVALGKYLAGMGTGWISVDPTVSLQGYIDELRIWSYNLTQEMIQENMNRRIAEDTPGLLVQWHFDDDVDPPDGLFSVSAQGYTLALIDSNNPSSLPCQGSSRPVHSSLAAPVWAFSGTPYTVVSYIPTSAVGLTSAVNFT